MKLRHPVLIKFIGFLASLLIRLWMGTLRYHLISLDDDEHPTDVRRNRFFYCVWHETILYPTIIPVKIHVLISSHADGELIAQVCRHLRFDVVRGSSTRGGVRALRELRKVSERTHVLVTPDGPRGPRRQVQPGVIFLASQTGLPIVPCGFAFGKAWRARSWDRFAVPLPWTSAYGIAGKAIHVPPRIKKDQLEHYRLLVEQQMLEMTAQAEAWAAGQGAPRRERQAIQPRRSA